MINNLTFSVNVDILLRAGISINQYFMLQLISNKLADLYLEYRTMFANPVNKEDLNSLIEKGYLKTRDDPNKFTFENLIVTDSFYNLNGTKVEDALYELEETYPKKTPLKGRRLHSNPAKWRKDYLTLIKKQPELHRTIINSIKAEAINRKKIGDEEYWTMLTTYINQERWKDYENEGECSEEDKFSKDI